MFFIFFYSGDRKTFYIPFTSKTRHWFWILCGIFSGAAAAAAARFFRLEEFEGKTIVAVLQDTVERYLSTLFFGIIREMSTWSLMRFFDRLPGN